MNSGLSDSVEAHCYMEGFGDGVGRLDIHLTDHSRLPGLFRRVKKVVIEEPADPKTSRRYDDAIDVNKPLPFPCHPDRSEAERRDLRFRGPFMEMFFDP